VTLQGDILVEEVEGFDWSTQADFVFTNSLMFTDEMMEQIAIKAENMKPQSWFISTMRPLVTSLDEEHKTWDQIAKVTLQMSWGPSTLFVHRKL
jgi:hypothetical protein